MNELVQGSVLVDVATDSHFYHATCALVYRLCGLLSVFHVGIYVFLSCVFYCKCVSLFHALFYFLICTQCHDSWTWSIDAWTARFPERQGTSVPRRSLRPTVYSQRHIRSVTDLTRNNTAAGLLPLLVRRLEQSSGPCPPSEPHRSCFRAPAKDIFVRTVLAHPAR